MSGDGSVRRVVNVRSTLFQEYDTAVAPTTPGPTTAA
jgi:hypothetical protein